MDRLRHRLETTRYRQDIQRIKWKIVEIERSDLPEDIKRAAVARLRRRIDERVASYTG
jgi:hypothetical protein